MEWAVLAVAIATFAATGLAIWYARRAESRASDRGDVYWRIYRETADSFRVWNAGQDTAFKVRLVLTVAEHSVEASAERVAPNDGISVTVSVAGTLHARWMQRRDRWNAVGMRARFLPESMDVRLHITWSSEAGRWTTRETVEAMTSALE